MNIACSKNAKRTYDIHLLFVVFLQPNLYVMRLKLFILFICSVFYANAQQKLLRFVEAGTGKPVVDADVYTDSVYLAATNYNGNVRITNSNFKNLIIDHINYQKRIVPGDSLTLKKVYTLVKRSNVLDEVVLDSRVSKDSTTSTYWNFTYGMKAANRIDAPVGSTITTLKFRVTNGANSGVKGLNFLPFMANVYELDSITRLPGKPLLPKDVLVENKSGNDWAVADISAFKITVPAQGACIVFIIPDYEDGGIYKTFWISSKKGLISAVPNLKHKATLKKLSGSYLYVDFVDSNARGSYWKATSHVKFMMETEFYAVPH